jgi:hypothetical protein
MDQDVINLAKAIREKETGNKPIAGGSGEIVSRYQYMPSTWKQWAGEILGDSNAPTTLENENKVAYTKIKEWKDKGLRPDQIAAKWNSGGTEYVGKVGVNSAGVKFDVPAYVADVKNRYLKIKAETANAAPAVTPTVPEQIPEGSDRLTAFKATGKEGTISAPAKFLGNIPSSAIQFAKDLPGFINPIENIKKISSNFGITQGLQALTGNKPEEGYASSIWSEGGALLGEQGLKEGVINAAKEVIPDILTTAKDFVVPQALQGLATYKYYAMKGEQEKADTILNDKFKQLIENPTQEILMWLPIFKGLRGATGAADALRSKAEMKGYVENIAENTAAKKPIPAPSTRFTGAFDKGIETVARPAINTAKTVFGKPAQMASDVARFTTAQATGLQPETISQIQKTPESFTKQARESINRVDVAKNIEETIKTRIAETTETGKEYGPVREIKTPINVGKADLSELFKKHTGVEIDAKGKLKASASSVIREKRDVTALQHIYDLYGKVFNKGFMTVDEFLNLRGDLRDMAKFGRDVGKSKPLENMAAIMRAELNAKYRKQIPGLDKLDETFGKHASELEELRKGIVDNNGNITDAGIKKIANLNQDKPVLMKQLEKLSPGITQRVKVLKAVEDIQRASGIKVGAYTRTALTGGAFFSTGLVGGLVTAIMTSPELAVPILRAKGVLQNKVLTSQIVKGLKEAAGAANQFPVNPQKSLEAAKRLLPERVPMGLSLNPVDAAGKAISDRTLGAFAKKPTQSTFYRGGGTGEVVKGKTAQDIIDYETKELGNKIKVEDGANLETKSENLKWLTTKSTDAKMYGKVEKIPGNFKIIARDNYGGVLVDTRPIESPKTNFGKIEENPFVESSKTLYKTKEQTEYWKKDNEKNLLRNEEELIKMKKERPDNKIGIRRIQGNIRYWKKAIEGSEKDLQTFNKTVFGKAPEVKPIGQQRITKIEDFSAEPKLTGDAKKMETQAFEHILKDEDAILSKYAKEKGNVVNADEFRPLFSERGEWNVGYAGHNAANIQEPASYLAKRAYSENLNNPEPYMLATSGGSGAGKSSALNNVPEYGEMTKQASVILDSNLSSHKSAVQKIKEAREKGKQVEIFYVYRDPLDAYTNGVVYRMLNNKKEMGRLVPNHVIAGNHIGSWEVIKKLYEEGIDGKPIDIYFVDNALGIDPVTKKNKAKVFSFEEAKKKINYPSVEELTKMFDDEAKRLRDLPENDPSKLHISEEQYRAYLKRD